MKWTSACGNQHSRKLPSSHIAPPSTQAQCWVPLPHAHRPDTSTPSTPSIWMALPCPFGANTPPVTVDAVAVDLGGPLRRQEGGHRRRRRGDHRTPSGRPVGMGHRGDRLDHGHRVDLGSAVRGREAHPHEIGIDQRLHRGRRQTPRLLCLVGMGLDDLCEVGGSFDDSGRHLADCRRRARVPSERLASRRTDTNAFRPRPRAPSVPGGLRSEHEVRLRGPVGRRRRRR